jgi:D-alanine-D-alanine ligase
MKSGKVIIFHSPLQPDAPADELDVLDQAAYFEKGLRELGFQADIIPFPYDLTKLSGIICDENPQFVVNLVETIFGNGRLVHLGPSLFEHLMLSYSGCSADAIYLTSNKIIAKQLLQANGIPTPAWYDYASLQTASQEEIASPFIVKSLWEHASFGLDEAEKLLFSSGNELLERFSREANPDAFFCEAYIHGREFNLSVINGISGPEVLPPAEIRFEYPEGKPRILGYKAKWEEESFEYKHTVRTFEFPVSDEPLLDKLKFHSLQCWKVFRLSGYARVDFRVDEAGNIFVLEINANPCISPDSGFVAACHKAGLSDTEVVARIIKEYQNLIND